MLGLSKIVLKYIILFGLNILSISLFAQTDSINFSSSYANIDSFCSVINKKNPPKITLHRSLTIDSLLGIKLKSIKKQSYKEISKFTLVVQKPHTMVAPRTIELYLLNDSIVNATIYYDRKRAYSWKKFYFKNNMSYSMVFTNDIKTVIGEQGDEFIKVADFLLE
jgi:hypothetical protein